MSLPEEQLSPNNKNISFFIVILICKRIHFNPKDIFNTYIFRTTRAIQEIVRYYPLCVINLFLVIIQVISYLAPQNHYYGNLNRPETIRSTASPINSLPLDLTALLPYPNFTLIPYIHLTVAIPLLQLRLAFMGGAAGNLGVLVRVSRSFQCWITGRELSSS